MVLVCVSDSRGGRRYEAQEYFRPAADRLRHIRFYPGMENRNMESLGRTAGRSRDGGCLQADRRIHRLGGWMVYTGQRRLYGDGGDADPSSGRLRDQLDRKYGDYSRQDPDRRKGDQNYDPSAGMYVAGRSVDSDPGPVR